MKQYRLFIYSAVLALFILMLLSASPVMAGSAPTADAGGPYEVQEGESVQLDASGSFDPDQPPDSLDYAWDLDDDGSYETPGMRPTFSAAGLTGPEIHLVRLLVTDDEGFFDAHLARITVTVTPPTVHPPGFASDVLLFVEIQREFSGMTVGHLGELVVADIGEAAVSGDERLYIYGFDPLTVTISSTGLPLGAPGRMATGSGHPLIGKDLVLADWNSNETAPCCSGTVFQLNHWAFEYTTLATGNPAYPPPGDPFGVAIGQGGAFGDDIYVMDFEGASPYPPVLYRINDDGSQSVVATDPAVWTLIRKPTDIAIDPGGSFGGDLFAVDAVSPPTIWRVTAAGDISTFYSSVAIPEPVAVAFGPGGPFGTDMYVFDDSHGKIYTITPDGLVSTFASGLPQNAPLSITPDMVFSNDGLTLFIGTGPSIFRIDAVEEMIEIYPQVQGDLGANDWYVGDVSVTWDNPPPGASIIEGCQNSIIDYDTASIELTCSYRHDGAFYSGSVLVKRDTTPPQPGCNIQPGATYPMTEGESLAVDCSSSTDNLSTVQASFDTNEDGIYGDAPVFNAIDESVTPCFIGVRLADEAGNVTAFTTDIIVANAPPTVKIVQVDNQNTAIGGDVTVYVDVEDPGVNDVLTAFVDWGDGTSLSGWVVPTMISALPAHTYNQPGAYTVAVTIIDDAGAASIPDQTSVTVEDPLQTIDFLEDEVIAAMGAGLYNHGQENSLRAKLDNASASITRQAFEAAAGQLRAFAHQGFAITDPDGKVTPCFDLALQMAEAFDFWVPDPNPVLVN